MKSSICRLMCIGFTLAVSNVGSAEEPKAEEGVTQLFNGKDLTGWGYKSGEKFDGKTESDDKRLHRERRHHHRQPRQRDRATLDDGQVSRRILS